MRVTRLLKVFLFAWLCGAGWAEPSTHLEWDAIERGYSATPADKEAVFVFHATNRTAAPVEIKSVGTSCHCTVATPPRKPWIIAPGATDDLTVRVDLLSRRGGLTKTIYVETSLGEDQLMVHVRIPPPAAARREMNFLAAQADRQAVLKGDCASCHVTPTIGKVGAELFTTACVICHAAENRATMVPDLRVAKVHRDAAYWDKWIRLGGEGTLMPAFSRAHDGSLDDEQIQSLVEYLVAHLPTDPQPSN